MDHVWELVILLVTNILTGGFMHFFTISSTKRKESAAATQLERIADQESEKAQSQKLSNTENVIRLYKEALNDIRELNEREKSIMMDTIREQDKKLNDFDKVIKNNKELISELQNKLNLLSLELKSMKRLVNIECNSCPQSKLGCLNPKYINSIRNENN